MKRVTFLLSAVFSVSLGLLAGGVANAQTCDALIEFNTAVKMRDGVVLRADVFRPRGEGKHPVILFRTPYNRITMQPVGCRVAARGYVAVIQDVRGRFASGGAWYPMAFEGQDGYDTVEWAAALPYSDGRVVMAGGSYLGVVQMAAAIVQPPHLAAIAPVATPSDPHNGMLYQGGAFAQLAAETWTSLVAIDSADRILTMKWAGWKPRDPAAGLPAATYQALNWPDNSALAPFFADWLAHPDYDDFWKPGDFGAGASKIQVPALHAGGWYDIFTNSTLRNFTLMKSKAATEAARRGQRLVMGPWSHGGLVRKVGQVDFGPEAVRDEVEMDMDWYDSMLKGSSAPARPGKPVKIFVMGKNIWREEEDWPLARARATPFYLHAVKGAASAKGDGTLDTDAPVQEQPDRYTYDPANPVPTRGGGLCCSLQYVGGPFDQRGIEERPDVLVYSTAVLKQDLEATGPISAELYVSSSAPDTDFTAKLVDVDGAGVARNVSEGILRMRYRNSFERQELMRSGAVYKIQIEMNATSNVFLAGHRLRLEISSSNYPHFDRNLNTGQDQGHSTAMARADNVVYHDREHPSAIVLPVVSGTAAEQQ
jgi:putative CocE/NonD family hydrolase